MLESFSISNSRSFESEATLLLTRSRRRSGSARTHWDQWSPLSPVAGLYGANASGKSNFLVAMAFFVAAVRESHNSWDPNEGLPLPPAFALQDDRPATFELVFWTKIEDRDVRFQYGFEATRERVVREWLYSYPKKLQRVLFERDTNNAEPWYFGDTLRGQNRAIADLTRANSLFLSAAASNNHADLSRVFTWITRKIAFMPPHDHEDRLQLGVIQLQTNDAMASRMLALLRSADLGIRGVDFDLPEIADDQVDGAWEKVLEDPNYDARIHSRDAFQRFMQQSRADVELEHWFGDRSIALPLWEESTGTQALLGMAYPLFEAIDQGRVIVIDEIDTSLHPVLVRAIVQLFKSKKLNRAGAQLIFSSHDVTLLMQDSFDEALLDSDQIWFVEKDSNGRSTLYPLSDFKPRDSHSLLRGYLQGRYGAVPRIDWRALLGPEQIELASGAPE